MLAFDSLARLALAETTRQQAGGISAELAVTLDNATLAATAALRISGQATVQLDDVALSATAELDIKASETTQLDDATLSATGELDIAASLSVTLDDADLSSQATIALAGSVNVTLDEADLTSTAMLQIQAVVSQSLDDVTLLSTAEVGRVGSLDVTLDDATLFFDSTIRLPNTDSDGFGDGYKKKRRRKSQFRKAEEQLDKALAKAFEPKRKSNIDRLPWLVEPVLPPQIIEAPQYNERLAGLNDYVSQIQAQLAQRKFELSQEEADTELLLMSL
jgi:hypothetical protein